MNPTQVGNLIKSGLLAIGVSTTIVGYVSAEVWTAIGGVVIAISAAIWQFASLKTEKIIEATAAMPEVKEVSVNSAKLAISIPNTKVVVHNPQRKT